MHRVDSKGIELYNAFKKLDEAKERHNTCVNDERATYYKRDCWTEEQEVTSAEDDLELAFDTLVSERALELIRRQGGYYDY